MDGKGFFLGLIAAVVLFLLWKKESNGSGMNFSFTGLAPQPSSSGGCAGCAGGAPGCAGCGNGQPSYAAAPTMQAALADQTGGQITPGTPPLQSVVGSGSFYAGSGPTPDSSFTNVPGKPVPVTATYARTQTTVHNVPSSPSTPSTIVPTRAVGVVPSYRYQGFQQRYNVAGVPRTALRTLPLVIQQKMGVA